MKNLFDSRLIGCTDAYGQRFMRKGSYRYDLIRAPGRVLDDDRPYTIEVGDSPKNHKMKQHFVAVQYKKDFFQPNKKEIKIKVGDLVLWSCRQPTAPPFMVIGDKEFFGNDKMINECGYAHAFGVAGEYPWVDIHRGKLSGMVRVHNPECQNDEDFNKWHQTLSKGSLVMISGESAEPAEIDILVGQTVYFAVTKTEGVSVTDRRIAEVLQRTSELMVKEYNLGC